jgi:hypothetical protein
MWTHHTYGFAMYGYWGAILIIAMLNNAHGRWWQSRASRSTSDVEGRQALTLIANDNPLAIANTWWKKNFIIPPIFGTRRRQLYYNFSVPTRLEAIVIFTYWILSLMLCAANYRAFEGNF